MQWKQNYDCTWDIESELKNWDDFQFEFSLKAIMVINWSSQMVCESPGIIEKSWLNKKSW